MGSQSLGVTYEQRGAAYAVIRNSVGAVAAVRVPAGYWLPGGGMLPGETPEETVVREVREELGGTLHPVSKIGEAAQYFFAATEGRYYVMQAVFYRAKLTEGASRSCGVRGMLARRQPLRSVVLPCVSRLGRASGLRRVEDTTRPTGPAQARRQPDADSHALPCRYPAVWDLGSRGIPGHRLHMGDVTFADLCISSISSQPL